MNKEFLSIDNEYGNILKELIRIQHAVGHTKLKAYIS